MAIQEQYILVKKTNGDVGITQNSIEVFSSINTGAIVNTLVLKEGMVGIGLVAPTTKLHIQVSSTGNKQALLIEQLDSTNNPICAEINNDGTNHGLYIHQDGVLAASKYGLYVYSNAVQVNAQLVVLVQDNASSTQNVLELQNDGTGVGFYISQIGNGIAQTIVNAGSKHGLYINQSDVLDASNYGLYVYSNAVQVNSYLFNVRNNNGSSTYNMARFDNVGTGSVLEIVSAGVIKAGALTAGCLVYSNAIQANNPLLLVAQDNASSTANVMEVDNDGTGHALYIHQDGVLAANQYGLYVYSNAVQVNSTFMRFNLDNASATANLLEIINGGTGHGLYLLQSGVLAASRFGLYVYSNAIQINSPLIKIIQDNASSTAGVMEIDADGTGHVLYIQQDGNLATGKYALYIDNNGTPTDGAGRCIRLDGCTVSGTGTILGYLGFNVDGIQRAVGYYAVS